MWGSCPTHFDESQALAGGHTAFMWQKLPFHIRGDANNWPSLADQAGEQMWRLWCQFAPNLEHSITDRFTQTPLQIVESYPNMQEGDLLVGAFTDGQVGYHRPFTGAGHYRGHPEGLYLCGSSSHPGGNITGLPGHNCAAVVLADLGMSSEPAAMLEERLAGLA